MQADRFLVSAHLHVEGNPTKINNWVEYSIEASVTDISIEEKSSSLSETLANFVATLGFSSIPREVVEKVKLHLLDSVGILAAAHDFDIVRPAIDIFYEMGGKEESFVVGKPKKIPAVNAAFCNAVILHSLDFDDTHLHSVTHVSATAIPTALAVGELLGSSGEEMITAITAGYEVGTRIGNAYPRELHHRGFHPTSVVGTFIAATVAGKLLKLSKEELSSAYGIAGSFSSGILQSVLEGYWVKPFHPAWTSHGGILAAKLAKSGYGGPKQILEGENGIFNTFLYGNNKERIDVTSTLGKTWETMNISLKPYPTCHATHSSIDAIRNIRERIGKNSDKIKNITVCAPQLTFDIGVFGSGKTKPATPYEAKFSIPYTIAVAILHGNPSIWDFTDKSIRQKDFLKISEKVKGAHDSDLDKYSKVDSIPAKIIVELEGDKIEELVIDHRGTPGNPVTKKDVVEKFRNNLSKSRFNDKTESILNVVLGIEKENISRLASFLS